jgi:DivIVA domain-containing protein
MKSFWKRQSPPAKFRTAWRGYDRQEVDEFLRRADADRQRLRDELALLAGSMGNGVDRQDLSRLSAVRREVAACLETSIGALRTATDLLGAPLPRVDAVAPAERMPPPIPAEHLTASLRFREARTPDPPAPPRLPAPERRPRRFSAASLSIVKGRPAVAGGGLLALLLVAGFMYQREPSANEASGDPGAAVPAVAQAAAPTPAPEPPPPTADEAPADPPREDGLVVALTALRSSWVGSTLDGGQRMERLLALNETILLRATSEVILRVGDATAVSILINNQPARPLGATGQVVTTKITKDNYRKLLLN